MIKLFSTLIVLVLLLNGCQTKNVNQAVQDIYVTNTASSKNAKIFQATEDYISIHVKFRGFIDGTSVKEVKRYLPIAIRYCEDRKKNTYYFTRKGKVNIYFAPVSPGGQPGINDILAYNYFCAKNLESAKKLLIKRSIFNHRLFQEHWEKRGVLKHWETKRNISSEEIAENKRQALEEKRKASALKKQQRNNLIAKLENVYSKDCIGGLFNKKFEKGTKEYENCLFEKNRISEAKFKAEKKAIVKRQVETDKKLAAMTPKQRHAYNCSNAFNFRKGTEKFNDCVFKLYTAELDIQKLELEKKVAEAQIQAAANSQARAEAVANAQIAAAKASQRAASLNNSIQLMQMGSSMLGGSSAPKSNDSFGIQNRVRTTCRNVGGFINCN
jgi:hypothetical protein